MLTDRNPACRFHSVVNSLYMLWDWSAFENVMFPRMGIRGQLLLGVMVMPILAVLDICVKLAGLAVCSNLMARDVRCPSAVRACVRCPSATVLPHNQHSIPPSRPLRRGLTPFTATEAIWQCA